MKTRKTGWMIVAALGLAWTLAAPALAVESASPAPSAQESAQPTQEAQPAQGIDQSATPSETEQPAEQPSMPPGYLPPPVSGISSYDVQITRHAPITQQLILMVRYNPQLKRILEESIHQAKVANPDPQSNPAQTLEQYYDFLDWASTAKPWNILPDLPYPKLYETLDQSLSYLHFINSQPLESLAGKGYYHNSVQYTEPYRSWFIAFTTQWGQFLNTTDSWSEQDYQLLLQDERFGLGTETYEAPFNWQTCNQFLARRLSSPQQRPITLAEDDTVVVSPADARPQGVWNIEQDGTITGAASGEAGAEVKSARFTNVGNLLGEGSAYQEAFYGGTMTHTMLDINDYHRFHFPVSGIVKEVRILPGDSAPGGVVVWDETNESYVLQSTAPGWQTIETRGCVVIETPEYGMVAVLPVGASPIGSVNFESNVTVGAQVQKGDEMGCFLFGGSDVVMLFQKDVEFALTVNQLDDGSYDHILMGAEYARIGTYE